MTGNSDLILVFTALTAICSFLAFLTLYYHRVYRPRKKDKEQKRNEIYKPLIKDVDALIEKVTKKEKFSPPFNWKTIEDKVSTQLYEKLQRLFEEKYDYYYKLLQHNQIFVRFKNYFYLNSSLSELQEEFRKLGFGKLEYELYESIVTLILEGEKITLRWLEEKKTELYEKLEKCPSYKKTKKLFDWLNEENPSIISFRRVTQDLLQSAKELEHELKSF